MLGSILPWADDQCEEPKHTLRLYCRYTAHTRLLHPAIGMDSQGAQGAQSARHMADDAQLLPER